MASFDKTESNNQNSQIPDDKLEEYSHMTLTQLIEDEILPNALQFEIGFYEFFEYTIKEIKIIIKAFNERQKNELRIRSQMDFVNCSNLASMIACLFSKDAHMPKYEESYSFLYDASELSDIEERKQQAQKDAEMKRIQANLLAMANSFNAKFNKDNEPKDSGE